MIFALNLVLYLGYLLSLTYYVLNVAEPIRVKLIDDTPHRCPIVFTEAEVTKGLHLNQTLIRHYKKVGGSLLGVR